MTSDPSGKRLPQNPVFQMGTLEHRVESGVYLLTLTSGAGCDEINKMGNDEDRASHLTEESGDQERVRTAMA